MRWRKKTFWIGFYWLLAAGWIALLFYFSGQTAVESSQLSQGLAQALLDRLQFLALPLDRMDFILRKLAHFGIFALEGLFLGLALLETMPQRRWTAVLLAALGGLVLAVLNELHQMFSVGRSCEVRDMLIDFGGAAAGVFAAMLLFSLCRCFGPVRKRRE